MPRLLAPPLLRRRVPLRDRQFWPFATETICFPSAACSTVAGWLWQNGEHLSQSITNAAAMLWLLFLIIAITITSKDIPRKFPNPMLPWGFVVLITCVFMVVIGQRGTVSGFALIVALSVRVLQSIATPGIPTLPTHLDPC